MMFKSKIIVCLAICFTFVNSSFIEIDVEPVSDVMGRIEDDIDDLLDEVTSADMCPIKMCQPSLIPRKYDLEYYLDELQRGDLNTFIRLMTKLTAEQRQEVNEAFFERTGGKYIKDVIKMKGMFFTRNLEMALARLMMTPEEIFAEDLNYELHRTKINVERVTEILFTVNNYGLLLIADAYGNMFGSTIQRDINARFRYNPLVRNLLSMRAQQGRKERKKINVSRAARDGDFLYNNRQRDWEPYFNKLVVRDSADQLNVLFDYIENTYGLTMEHFIKHYANSKISDTYLDIVTMLKRPYIYLARRLFDTMDGLGTSDRDLMRIIIGRGEIDLASIEDAYNNDLPEVKRKRKNLRQSVVSDIHLSKRYAEILTSILAARGNR